MKLIDRGEILVDWKRNYRSERPVDAPDIIALATNIASRYEMTEGRSSLNNPVHVVPIPEDKRDEYDGYEYLLLNGFRRFTAFEYLQTVKRFEWAAEIPCNVDDGCVDVLESEEDRLITQLGDNLTAENPDHIDTALAYQRLVDHYGFSQRDLASLLGLRAQSQVSYTLSLLKLPPALQEDVRTGDLSLSHARQLIRLPDHGLMTQVYDAMCARARDEKLTTAWIRNLVEKLLSPAPAEEDSADGPAPVDADAPAKGKGKKADDDAPAGSEEAPPADAPTPAAQNAMATPSNERAAKIIQQLLSKAQEAEEEAFNAYVTAPSDEAKMALRSEQAYFAGVIAGMTVAGDESTAEGADVFAMFEIHKEDFESRLK